MCWDEDDMFWFEEEKSVYPEAKLYQFISATDRGRAAVAYIILPLYQIFLQSPLLLDIFWNNALLGKIQYTLHREQALSQPFMALEDMFLLQHIYGAHFSHSCHESAMLIEHAMVPYGVSQTNQKLKYLWHVMKSYNI